MRSEKEIRDMIKLLDEAVVLDKAEKYKSVYNDEDFEYLYDAKAVLNGILKKMLRTSTKHEKWEIEEIMTEIEERFGMIVDGQTEDEENASDKLFEIINEGFNIVYKNRDFYSIGNVCDTFYWIKEKESTERYLSNNFLDIENFRRKMKAIM